MNVRIATMPENIEDIREERRKLLEQRKRIDDRLRLIDEFLLLKKRLFDESEIVTDELDFEFPEDSRRRPRNVLSPTTIAEYVRDILLEAGRPMKRGALLKALDKRGIPIVGTDRAKVLGTMIWRAKEADGQQSFVNTSEGYWPSDVPVPE